MKNKNKQLENLKMEIKLFMETIVEVEKHDFDGIYSSHVVGELKHRGLALKRTLTKLNKITTADFKN